MRNLLFSSTNEFSADPDWSHLVLESEIPVRTPRLVPGRDKLGICLVLKSVSLWPVLYFASAERSGVVHEYFAEPESEHEQSESKPAVWPEPNEDDGDVQVRSDSVDPYLRDLPSRLEPALDAFLVHEPANHDFPEHVAVQTALQSAGLLWEHAAGSKVEIAEH